MQAPRRSPARSATSSSPPGAIHLEDPRPTTSDLSCAARAVRRRDEASRAPRRTGIRGDWWLSRGRSAPDHPRTLKKTTRSVAEPTKYDLVLVLYRILGNASTLPDRHSRWASDSTADA